MDDDVFARQSQRFLTRRRLLAAIGGTLGAGGAGAVAVSRSGTASADVTMGELQVSDTSETVDGEPQDVTLAVSGEFSTDTDKQPEQVQISLLVAFDGSDEQIAETARFDTRSGSYSVEGSLYQHSKISADSVTPDSDGETTDTPLSVSVRADAVVDGEVVVSATVSDDGTLSLSKQSAEMNVGGDGGMTVQR